MRLRVRRLRLCLRLCRRREMNPREGPRDGATSASRPALPERDLLTRQADWLAPARAYLFRLVQIAHRRRILDLGTGYGAVLPELQRRAGGSVIGLDIALDALRTLTGVPRVGADGRALPFPDETFDLIYSQLTLLWISPLEQVISEIWRTLTPGGVLVALEPDYGGMIEAPPQIEARSLWLDALPRAGADPYVARRLPHLLSHRGFDVQIGLFNELGTPDPARFDFLAELPLTDDERAQLEAARTASAGLRGRWAEVAHLPFFMVRAEKGD